MPVYKHTATVDGVRKEVELNEMLNECYGFHFNYKFSIVSLPETWVIILRRPGEEDPFARPKYENGDVVSQAMEAIEKDYLERIK